jgi:hypothetical protein
MRPRGNESGDDGQGIVAEVIDGSLHETAGCFGGYTELFAHLAIAVGLTIEEPETASNSAAGSRVETIEQSNDEITAIGFESMVFRAWFDVGDEIDEGAVAVVTDRLVE